MSRSKTSGGRSRKAYRKPSNRKLDTSSNQQPIVELQLDAMGYDGRGIGRYEGRACFVEGGLAQELVKARIVVANNKRVEAELIKVLEPSSERVKPQCPIYDQCGGCDLQHLSHSGQIAYKQNVVEQMLARHASIESVKWLEPVVPQQQEDGYGYRRKVRLACYYDRSNQQLNVGFRRAKSKKIVSAQDCQIVSGSLKNLLQRLYDLLNELHCLDGASKTLSSFAHIECVSEQKGSEATKDSISFRLVKSLPKEWRLYLTNWATDNQIDLWFKVAEQSIEQVTSDDAYLNLSDDLKLRFTPDDFLQVNGLVNHVSIKRVMALLEVGSDDLVLDLFSGLGNFSLPAAQLASKVTAVEVVPEMVEKAKENAQLNGLENLECVALDLFTEDCVGALKAFGVSACMNSEHRSIKVILDPPRAGAELVAQHIAKTGASHIAYVSCNPLSLARDSKHLLEQGYQLDSLTLLDMFPQTSHVETLALFKCS